MPLTFDALQAAHATWSDRNFPDATPDEPLLGIFEEQGELAAAIQAFDNALWGSDADVVDAEVDAAVADIADAIGDTLIFATDYARRRGFTVSGLLNELGFLAGSIGDFQVHAHAQSDTDGHTFLGLVQWSGTLAHARLKSRQGIRGDAAKHLANERLALGQVVVKLAELCTVYDLDFGRIAAETWAEVSKRDWTARLTPATVPAEPDVFPMTFYPTLPGRNPYEN